MGLMLVWNSGDIMAQKRLGTKYYKVGRHHDALSSWQKVKKIDKDIDLLILKGISNYHTNNLDACIRDMSLAHSKKTKDNRVFKYAGLAYMSKYDYKEASNFFKSYLNTLKSKDKEYWWAVHQIKKCGLAINYTYKMPEGFVENLNIPVNTLYDELKPIISPNHEDRFYFNSNRKSATGGLRNKKSLSDEKKGIYHFDMFKTEVFNGQYEDPSIFLPILNSPQHDILQGFSEDGEIVYYIKSKNFFQGELLYEKFDLEKIQGNTKLELNIPFHSEAGDRDLFWVHDNLFLFSSLEHEGFGGYDIFYCQMIDGQWQSPVNMGSEINTKDNEISPFLVNSGDVLFFSCDKTETLGGFDIYKSANIDNKWSEPQSLNFPINSPRDDLDMFISPDGSYGLFSSNRAESIGGHDIYIAYFNEPIYEQREKTNQPFFTQLNSDIIDEKEVSFVLEDIQNSSIQRDFKSNSLTFKQGEMTLNPNNLNTLKTLTEILVLYPDLNVLLVSHTTPNSNNYTDLYLSNKRSEIVINELINNKISKDRLNSVGCGSTFPINQTLKPENSSNSNPNNDRMEIILTQNNYKGLRILYDFENLILPEKDNNWNNLHRSFQEMTYKIEIAQSFISFDYNSLVTDPSLVTIEKNNNSSFSYYFGLFNDIETAKLSTVKGTIVPFYKGIKLKKEEYFKYFDQYPELENLK